MLQNLQNIAKFQKFQLANLVDFGKCCKTRIFLQRSVPIQPKTSNILPKFCQKLATTLRVRRAGDPVRPAREREGPREAHPVGRGVRGVQHELEPQHLGCLDQHVRLGRGEGGTSFFKQPNLQYFEI